MSDELRDLIQQKKELQDYYTIKNGLITEIQCFEAIEALGNRKAVLKNTIQKMIDDKVAADDPKMQSLVIAAQKIHSMQSQVVKDVCERFEVIHPDYKNVTPELLQLKRPYWDWYRELYRKYYGHEAPEIIVDGKSGDS